MLILLVTTFLGILLAHHDGVLQDFNRYVLQRLPGDQNVTQLDTSQDESKHPYTSTTLMSINVHKCQLLQFQHVTRKAKTSYKNIS